MVNRRIKLVIFDMDGLMFDTEKLGIAGWHYALKTLGIPMPNKDLFLRKLGLNANDSRSLMIEELGQSFEYDKAKELKQIYVNSYIEKNGVPVKSGLFELLDYIDEIGLKKCIATSSNLEETRFYISKSGIKTDFDELVTEESVDEGKPSPKIFLKAAELLVIEPVCSLVLEDSPNGIKAAFCAEMLPVLIPDLILPDKATQALIFAQFSSLFNVIGLLSDYMERT